MANADGRLLNRLERYETGYRLPPMRLAADDLREIVAQIKKHARRDVYVLDADGEACDLEQLDMLSDHKLSQVTMHTRRTHDGDTDDQSVGMSVYLYRDGHRDGEPRILPEDDDFGPRSQNAVTQVAFHIIRLSRVRQDVRILFWTLFGLYTWTLIVLPGWYVAANGADPRLLTAGALVIAASIYTGLIATSQLANRMVIRRSGVVIEPGSRAEQRRRWRDTKHNLTIAVPTGVVSLIAGAALNRWLG